MENKIKDFLIFALLIVIVMFLSKFYHKELEKEINKKEYIELLLFPKYITKPYLEDDKITEKELSEIKEKYNFKYKKEKESLSLEQIKAELK